MPSDGDMVGALSNRGYRLTPQRLMIVAAIANREDHVSAEEIHSQVAARFPSVNISTVYRTLDLLKRLGLVTETDLGGGRFRYHPADKGRHHHLVCRECGVMIDLDGSMLESLEASLLEEHGFVADLQHLAITGHCADCRG